MEVEEPTEIKEEFNFPKFKKKIELFLTIWMVFVLLGIFVISIIITIITDQSLSEIWLDLFKDLVHAHPYDIIKFLIGTGIFGGFIYYVLVGE